VDHKIEGFIFSTNYTNLTRIGTNEISGFRETIKNQ
jgi:hypothetical protein